MRQTVPLSFETILRRTRPLTDSSGGEPGLRRIRSAPWYLPEASAGRTMPHGTPGDWIIEQYLPEPPRQHLADKGSESLPMPQSVDPEAIARELDLAGCNGVAALRLRRRQFAQANHPDTVHPALNANATERMMIANRLVDQEVARRKRFRASS